MSDSRDNIFANERVVPTLRALPVGSPILQNGKLIGAVTHVLVSDPTRGYAVFAETMLEAAGDAVKSGKLKDAS